MQETASETTLERLRSAALELFGDRGYDGASMADLADRVGIAKPSLYNYFRSKDELLLDLVATCARDWAERCMEPFGRPGSFERRLGEHFRRVLEFTRERPHEVALFHMAVHHVRGELAEQVRALVDGFEREVEDRVEACIEEGIATGELEPGDSHDTLLFLGIFFHGLLFQQTSCPDQAAELPARAAAIWRALYRGVSGREPAEGLPS